MSLNYYFRTVCLGFTAMVLSACGGQTVADNQVQPTPTQATATAKQPTISTSTASEAQQTQPDNGPQRLIDITFTDAKLAGCVEATALANNWQTVDQMTQLSCPDKAINSIGGIQNLSALTGLDLKLNDIDELAPLAKLKKLKVLDLASNKLVDIKPLRGLTSLEQLNLGSVGQLDVVGNSIRDIAALANLTALKQLNLSNNQVSDLSPLKPLSQLEKVQLNGNQIREIAALMDIVYSAEIDLFDNDNIACAELSELETILTQGNVKKPQDCIFTLDILITDITFADEKLKSCVLDTASSEGWITIGEMAELVCDLQEITDLGGIESLKALNYLDLTASGLTDITALFELTTTNSIDLSGNEKIACARLDALEAELGSGVVNRPQSCSPITLILDLDFVDPTLERCVKYSARNHQWRTIEQMTSLSCPLNLDSDIQDLRGIEQLTALEFIDFSGRLNCREIDVLANSIDAHIVRPAACQR